MDEVNLLVGNETFSVSKKLLVDNSHYFKAMFSGNYTENNQHDIKIELIDAYDMDIILHYLKENELKVVSVSEIVETLRSAVFLQIDSIVKAIEAKLFESINYETWLQILNVAKEMSMGKLATIAEYFGIFEFEAMLDHVWVIPNFEQLHWYLKHPYLFVKKELQVFTFGEVWIYSFESQNNIHITDIISWLDFDNLILYDLEAIMKSESLNESASQLVKCLIYVKSLENPFSILDVAESKQIAIKEYGEESWNLVSKMIKESRRKGPNFLPAMIANKNEKGIDMLYRFSKISADFKPCLRICEGFCWGYSLCEWGAYKIVVACGEIGRGSGLFQRRVRVWDDLLATWEIHDIELPPRRHAAAVVHMDTLYLVGGIGSFRVVLSSGLSYNLKEQSWKNLPSLPEEIQSPSICVHKDEIYVGCFTKIYVLRSSWEPVIDLTFRPSGLCSSGDFIFISRNFNKVLSKYDTQKNELNPNFVEFKLNVAGICSTGKEIFAFTEDTDFRWEGGFCYIEYLNLRMLDNRKPDVIWRGDVNVIKFYAMPGCFPLVKVDELIHTKEENT